MARDARRGGVGDDPLARRRLQAVGFDERRAQVFRVVLAAHNHRAVALLEARQAARSFERDLLALPARFEDFAVQVAPVDDEIAVLVALEKRVVERDSRQLPVLDRIDQDKRLGKDGVRLERLQQSEALSSMRLTFGPIWMP